MIKNKIISLALLTSTTSLMAMYAEQASLYKDPRIMGMGGVNVAVGSYSTSVFSNPAGLTNIKKEHGYVVDLFNIGVNASSNIRDLAKDIKDVKDIEDDEEKVQAQIDLAKKYSGEHFHYGEDTYISLSKNSEAFAWSIGFLGAIDSNLMLHANNSNLAETSTRFYGATIIGIAKPYATEIGRLDIGMNFKYMKGRSYEGTIGISEIVDADSDALREKFENTYSAIGVDIGVTYKPTLKVFGTDFNPAVGFSILNIGSMDLDGEYGQQPLTVNLGTSISPKVKYINKLILAADYIDVFNANKLRIYNFNEKVDYTDYEVSGIMKHINLGMSVTLVDKWYFSTTLMTGLYQGAYTAGIDVELLLFKLNLATYEEQVGDATTEIKDRRYMAKIGLGW